MSEQFIGEIRMFAGNFAPQGWAFCDGQLLVISQHETLWPLLGTTYGGDGRTTFGLPDLRGRIPIHQGEGPGLRPRPIGQRAGSEAVAVTLNQTPSHVHRLRASTAAGTEDLPAGNLKAAHARVRAYRPIDPSVSLHASTLANGGGGQGHPNLMPFLCVNFIIALLGTFPSRP